MTTIVKFFCPHCVGTWVATLDDRLLLDLTRDTCHCKDDDVDWDSVLSKLDEEVTCATRKAVKG